MRVSYVKCDGCGRELADPSRAEPGWEVRVSIYDPVRRQLLAELDLCPDCRYELEKWFADRKWRMHLPGDGSAVPVREP